MSLKNQYKIKLLTETSIWKYIKTLTSFKSRKVVLTLALMVFISLTEGIGLLLLVPLLQLVGLDVGQGALGQIAGYISSFFTYLGIKPTLGVVLVIYVFVIGLNAFLYKKQSIRTSKIQYEFANHLRKRLFKAVTNANWLFFTRKRSSDFAHALTYEIERISVGTGQFLSLVASTLVLAVYIIFALKLSGIITGFIFVIGVILLLLLKNRTRKAGISGVKLSKTSKDMYSSTIKQLDGMKTIKSFNMEDENVRMFSKLSDNVSGRYMDAIGSYADVQFLFDLGSVVILSIIVFVLIEIMAIPTAELLILLFLFVRMIPRFSIIQRSYQYFINMLPAFRTVTDLEKICINASEPRLKRKKIEFNDSIRLEKVNFSYGKKEGKETNIFSIRDLNLEIKAGKTTAIVGSSGAGKSTIVDMVMGLIKPDEGSIRVDDEPLGSDSFPAWRERIGYVAQDTFLFNDRVRNNLLFADPDAPDEDIMEALELASADEFVLKLPDGLDTLVGDRGVLLSGGERQRLALARALIRRPSLLILDEATSNLDSKNEKRILESIEKLHGRITILIIAHRLSTIRNADIIYLIENGSLVESGTWNTLISKEHGHFKALADAQNIN